jgi:hypothetical protein
MCAVLSDMCQSLLQAKRTVAEKGWRDRVAVPQLVGKTVNVSLFFTYSTNSYLPNCALSHCFLLSTFLSDKGTFRLFTVARQRHKTLQQQ